ncbi:MAG: hypothetical protein P8P89_05395, partial [Paracoccaceae bacterium]|nr:hypothetical protein [Paracoccaceae bacterium]
NLFNFFANCGILSNLKIDFIDVDSDTWNISIDKLENKLRTLETNLAIRQEVAALMPAQVTLLITVFP